MDYLTEDQVIRLIDAAKSSRQGFRNSTIILLIFRHGLRRSECCCLTWEDVNFEDGKIFISRRKGSLSGHHPLLGDEIRRLRKLKRQNKQNKFVFESQQGNQIHPKTIEYMVIAAGKKLGLKVTPHKLRHSTGFHWANQGFDTRLIQDYLGHKNIQNTVVYTKTNPNRFLDVKYKSI